MLRTPACEVLGIEVPVVQAAIWPATSPALVAAVVSLALGDPGYLAERAHAVGAKVVHQVHTVGQARRVAELGVDVIIAQGSEAGGQGMPLGVGAMALIPQVVDAVVPVPVLAAGGVADGRGACSRLRTGSTRS
jgi:enoyl-[acyl-carrier protein] reductase II